VNFDTGNNAWLQQEGGFGAFRPDEVLWREFFPNVGLTLIYVCFPFHLIGHFDILTCLNAITPFAAAKRKMSLSSPYKTTMIPKTSEANFNCVISNSSGNGPHNRHSERFVDHVNK
jgi:hypothetical protein